METIPIDPRLLDPIVEYLVNSDAPSAPVEPQLPSSISRPSTRQKKKNKSSKEKDQYHQEPGCDSIATRGEEPNQHRTARRHDDAQDRMVTPRDKPKPHQCGYCPSSFRLKGKKAEHIHRVHFKDKSWECDFGDGAFFSEHELIRHMVARHSGNTPFKCQYCAAGFDELRRLEQHVVDVHSGDISCDVCKKTFTSRTWQRKHLKIGRCAARRTAKEQSAGSSRSMSECAVQELNDALVLFAAARAGHIESIKQSDKFFTLHAEHGSVHIGVADPHVQWWQDSWGPWKKRPYRDKHGFRLATDPQKRIRKRISILLEDGTELRLVNYQETSRSEPLQRPWELPALVDKVTSCSKEVEALHAQWRKHNTCQDCGNISYNTSSTPRFHTTPRNGYKCSVCDKTCTLVNCETCGTKLSKTDSFEIHKKQCTPKPQLPFQCSICDQVFKTPSGYTRHRKNCGTSNVCAKCGEHFPRRNDLTGHEKICGVGCQYCGKPSRLLHSHQDHEVRCEKRRGRKQLKQLSRKKQEISKDAVVAELMIEEPNVDQKSTEQTTEDEALVIEQDHQTGHVLSENHPSQEQSLERASTCGVCSRSFTRPSSRRSHERTCGKRYKCDVCNDDFSKRMKLTKHQRFCGMTYRCQKCGEAFPLPSLKKRHEANCGIGCHSCSKIFSDLSNRKRHEKRCKQKNNVERNIRSISNDEEIYTSIDEAFGPVESAVVPVRGEQARGRKRKRASSPAALDTAEPKRRIRVTRFG